jgi:hypothetical protein
LQKNAYAEIFSSILCQITEIFGKKGWVFGPRPQPYRPLEEEEIFFETTLFSKVVVKNISLFYLANPEIIGVEFHDRQIDRQTESKFLDTIHGWVCVFFSSQNFLPPYLLRLQGIK